MTGRNSADVHQLFDLVLRTLAAELPEEVIGNIRASIGAGDYGLALETISAKFREGGILIGDASREQIEALCRLLQPNAGSGRAFDEPTEGTIFERYVVRCYRLVGALSDYLSPSDLALASHLIDHGEAPEGMRILAWAITDQGIRVPWDLISKIREYAGDIIDPTDMPSNLEDFVL